MATACIQQVPRGPDLGNCADPPEGTYTYSEVGIGRCVSGPADMRFFAQDGRTWLAVSNVDQYHNFVSGSVLVLDWDSLGARLDALDLNVAPRILLGDLDSVSLPILDDDDGDGDGQNAWLGGLGYLEGYQRLVVTSRLTELSSVRFGRDELFVLDTSGLADGALSLVDDPILLQDDPFPVVTEPAQDRFFVGNLTDHSISVLRAGPSPEVIDVAGNGFAGDIGFSDADASGSWAAVSRLEIIDREELVQDAWTLTYVDHTTRLFVPSRTITTDVEPVASDFAYRRWESGGGDYTPSPFGDEDGLTGVADPVFDTDGTYGASFVAVRQIDNAIVNGVAFAGDRWDVRSELVRSPQGLLLGSPSVAPVRGGAVGLYYDLRDNAGDPADIAVALSADGVTFVDGGRLEAPDGVSYEDPFVIFDELTAGWRMWLTIRQVGDPSTPIDDVWSIGLSRSVDGIAWDEPVVVLTGPGGSPVAAPVMVRLEQRYGMWLAQWNGTVWDHAFSWSWDGWQWSEPVVVVPGDVEPLVAGVAADPPRAGVLVDTVARWGVRARDFGRLALDDLRPGRLPADLTAFELAVTSGQEIPSEIVGATWGSDGLVPGSVISSGGRNLLFATAEGPAGRRRIAVLGETVDGSWELVVHPLDMEAMLQPPDTSLEAFAPAVIDDGAELVMVYALLDHSTGKITTARAVSVDGEVWERVAGRVFAPAEAGDLDNTFRVPSSLERVPDGVRLWYTGSDGGTLRIFSATAPGAQGDFSRDDVGLDGVRMDVGISGSFDDVAVKDPLAVTIDGVTHVYYAGFDGGRWAIGHALVGEDGRLLRRTDPRTGQVLTAMRGQPSTFSTFGVASPVLLGTRDGTLEILYAGHDILGNNDDRLPWERMNGLLPRIGRARVDPAYPEQVLPAQRFPTAGDTLTFVTRPGGSGAQVIELETRVDDFANPGEGMSSLELDEARGFIYVTSKLFDQVLVVDVRDDSGPGFDDANAFDVETSIAVETRSGAGFMGAKLIPGRDLLALTMRLPDALALVDVSTLADDADKEVTTGIVRTFLPLPYQNDDAGADNSLTNTGGAGMALTADERTLLVTHFNGNGVAAFDLDLGAWGEEVAWIRDVGEAPHVVRISPDGRYAVVANYIGEVVDNTASGVLTVIDVDPASERYLEVVAWLVNR